MANKDIDKQIAVTEGEMTAEEAAKPDYSRVYKVYENTRIPVSRSAGSLWQKRYKECKRIYKNSGFDARWQEVVRYYQNDQGAKSNRKSHLSEVGTGRGTDTMYGTENVVFANVSALVPATYAKNPSVEITATKDINENKAKMFERLLDTLFRRRTAPGVNLKPRMRRLVVSTMLTNIGYLELSYMRKEDSSDEVVNSIAECSDRLAKAKDPAEIEEIEGKLLALDEKVSLLTPAGPKLRFRKPSMVFIDPNCTEPDLTDADYVIVGDYIKTSYIRAMYGKKNSKGEYLSIYKPTHVLSGEKDTMGHDEEINNFTLLTDEEGSEHNRYGYETDEEFKHNCRTLTWTVWDRVTRRVYLFNDKDWSWPIWVWDDPYKLSRFYPIFPMSFYTDPEDLFARSEVMYYLDQQDEINRIANERARMRHWVMSKVFVDKNSVKDVTEIQRFLDTSTEDNVHGIDLPADKKIEDVIGSVPAPSTKFEGLFDTEPVYTAINRMSSVTPMLRNVEFKTNTTNKAIETYESGTQMRLDEKVDAVEDVLGEVAGALLEMCVQFMPEETVVQLLGEEYVQEMGGWEQMTVEQLHKQFNLQIMGGSTLKPTSRAKKDQAMNLGQVLGQFANASPMVIVVLLKMLERAFSEDVVITEQEWTGIIESTMQQLQRGTASQGQGQGNGQEQQAQQGGDINEMMAQVEQLIAQLPDEARAALGEGIAKGIPLKDLVVMLTQQAEQPRQ